MSSFRIIAIRVLQDCDPHIRRVLKEDVTYFLCNDYEDKYDNEYDNERKWIGIIKKNGNENSALPDGFFDIPENPENPETKKQEKPTVNISAIVGKNGDGKSSLVELMLRIIFNFSKANTSNNSLFQIQGVEAILYYEIGDTLYSIKCSKGETDSFSKQREEEIKNLKNFFYTIVANYSIYAYNSRNFEREVVKNDEAAKEGESVKDDKVVNKDVECWINEVFHEDDSYQLPLVLNPMRIEGNFDVNREEDLCNQRLMALYTDLGDDKSARRINGNKIAEGYAFNLEKRSKFETTTLRQLFQSTWRSTALRNYADFLNGYLNDLNNTNNTNDSTQDKFDRQKMFWLHYSEVKKYWKKYKGLFDLAGKVIKEINKKENEDTDLKYYLEVALEKFEAFIENENEKVQVCKSLESVSNLIKDMNMTGLQFQRLVLILEVCELWSDWFKKDGFSENVFSDAIKKYSDAIQQSKNDNEQIKVDEHSLALLYVIYNTISIFSNTPDLQNLFDVKNRNFYLYDYPFNEGYHEKLSKCFDDLFIDEEQQHIKKKYDTLKLRQTINYLLFHSFKTNETKDVKIREILKYENYFTFKELFKFVKEAKGKCHEETIALLPPPIFKGEILVGEGKDDQPEFKISDLSSGELQMLHSINTYIYHLRNLNYHFEAEGVVKYPFVNLILEEVELYFHPEYQRQYVYQMLRQIERVKLKNIKGINIILVTHSPIVLTDIPKNNVLFLKEGKPVYVMQENTFGANIHALLQNGFFLEGVPMGEFANKKINKMFERLHNGDYSRELFDEIKLVSEPLLKTQLYQLFSLNKLPFGIDSNMKIRYGNVLKHISLLEENNKLLKRRIKELEEK